MIFIIYTYSIHVYIIAIEIEVGILKVESRVKNIENTNRVLLNRIRNSTNIFKAKEWVCVYI